MESLRRAQLIIVSVGLLIAGCLEERAADPAPTQSADASIIPAKSLPWGVTECRAAVAIVGVEAGKLAPYMPKGFRSLAMQELAIGSARDIKGDANIGVEGFVCKEGVGLNGTVPNILYGSVFSAVAPPADLKVPGMNFHFVKWDVLIPDADRRELLLSYGIPAREGSVVFARHSQQGGLSAYEATVRIDQVGEFKIQGSGLTPMDPGAFREYTATPHGFANFTTKYKGAVAQGGSVITVPATSWVAKVTGAGTFPAATFSGLATFYDGSIDLPARPSS